MRSGQPQHEPPRSGYLPMGNAAKWLPMGKAANWSRHWSAVMVASFFAMVLSWRPYAWRKLTAGIDPSWQAGLAAAFEHHLQWGPSLVFTFGPYGFVDNILPFYRATALLAVVYAVVVTW